MPAKAGTSGLTRGEGNNTGHPPGIYKEKIMIARSKKAFTLLELIVVVVVLGILAALAIPSFAKVKETAADKVALNSAQSIYRNAQALAAFDGVAVSSTHIADAGAETSVFAASNSQVTVVSGGETGIAFVCVGGAQATACN